MSFDDYARLSPSDPRVRAALDAAGWRCQGCGGDADLHAYARKAGGVVVWCDPCALRRR
jgi:hypothetical protein